MASNLSTQGSMTVKEYEEYFLKHEVCKTMSEKSLISMYLACLNETVRNSLKGTKFSTLEKLMECARLAEHPIEQRCMTVEEYKQFFDNHEKEGIYDSDWCMDESEHHSVEEDLTDDTLSSGEFRETEYRDEDPDERPENDSQTSSDND
ncbi:unnamed protein product [Brassica oleracea var. botrytis]